MRVGVFIESLPDTGGGFQQGLTTVEALNRARSHDCIVFTPHERTRARLAAHAVPAVRFADGVQRTHDLFAGGRHLDRLLDSHSVDVAIFNELATGCRRIARHPFMVTVWDIDHRDRPEFPEAYRGRVFQSRERTLEAVLPKAMAVIANSASGARRIAELYGIDAARILVLPFLPSLAVRRHAAGHGATPDEVRRKYRLPEHFVFYPVYFLPQKNHLYVLEGLAELERVHGMALDAVFCGGGAAEQVDVVRRHAAALGLAARTHFLGWVPDDDMPALYETAQALVMPTYCGPTNLPPLEAAALGCPVIYSDLPGCREQMRDAALYCDLSRVSTLAAHLRSLANDAALRERLREAGRRLARELDQIDYARELRPVLDAYADTRRRWTWPAAVR